MRLIAIHTGPDTHLDHLGVLACLLNIPLIVTSLESVRIAKKFYPKLNCIYKDSLDLSLQFLADNYEAIITSGHFCAAEMTPLFEIFFQKKMRMIYCPHGNSDKGYSLQTHPRKDITLVYGEHMLDLLKRTGSLSQHSAFIMCGNFRAYFYLKNKSFYDALVKKKFSQPLVKEKKILLYAPTWSDQENTSSFFDRCEELINSLKYEFNLLIKLHPFLEQNSSAYTSYIIEKYKKTRHVVFLSSFPAIYPLLNLCDGYLGDFSSIGYDMLFFKKPMFFLRSHHGIIYKCGKEIPPNVDILSFIQENWEKNKEGFKECRKKAYKYVFGRKRSEKTIIRDIKKALSEDRARN